MIAILSRGRVSMRFKSPSPTVRALIFQAVPAPHRDHDLDDVVIFNSYANAALAALRDAGVEIVETAGGAA